MKKFYIIFLLVICFSQFAYAEESLCVRNQYLMAERLHALRQKAVDVIEQVSGDQCH